MKKPGFSAVCFPVPVDNFALLEALQSGPQTGVALAGRFGVSRAAVWKRIELLRRAGLQIDALGRRGYAVKQPTPLLDLPCLRAALPAAAEAQLAGLHLVFETPSTQALAMAVAAPPSGIEVWLAEMQTAGQGRRGKRWLSVPLSGIACSLNRRFHLSFAAMSGFSLACAVIIAESLQRQGAQEIQVKWPNDIWRQGRKCAGLLIQLRGESQGPCDVTLGFGINVTLAADSGAAIDQPWTSLTVPGGPDWDRNTLLAGLLQDLLHGFEHFQERGFSPFIARYRALDGLYGKTVAVEDSGRRINGTACGVDDSGAMLVETPEGLRRFHSGEVSVRIDYG